MKLLLWLQEEVNIRSIIGSKERQTTCDHCHKIGYTKERCRDLHGKPEDNQFPSRRDDRSDEVKFFNRKDSRGNSAISEDNSDTLELHILAKKNLSYSISCLAGNQIAPVCPPYLLNPLPIKVTFYMHLMLEENLMFGLWIRVLQII